MLGLKELAQRLAVWVNGEYSGFGESAYDLLGVKADDDDYKIPTVEDVHKVGVKSILVEYNTTDSTTPPESGWVKDEPKNIDKPFWSRITITRPDGEENRFIAFSGGSSGGVGSSVGSVTYKLPDIVDGSNYTPEQLDYWKNKFYPIIEKDLFYTLGGSKDSNPVTIDTPVTRPGILDNATDTYNAVYTSIAIRVRYRGLNPNINQSIVPPAANIILADIEENDSTYEIIKCRVKDKKGDVWEGFVSSDQPTRPRTVVGNKFKFGNPCFTTSRYSYSDNLVVNREVSYELLKSAKAVDYSDATTNYNDETPFAYVIPKGDTVITFDKTTGLYNYKGYNVIIQPYVGRWKAPMFYIQNGYAIDYQYTRPADITIRSGAWDAKPPTMTVPTLTHPGRTDSDRLDIFQSK